MLFRQFDSHWSAQAPAKVNLSLRIVGKRPDGYHNLETVMARVGLYDTLHFEPTAAELSLHVVPAYPPPLHGVVVPNTPENLVLRAAELLRQTSGYRGGARITLVKRIPPAAGLGGGSSDAAATLVMLNRAWNLRFDRTALIDLATRLGSDVPFFVANHAYALCTGRGEQLKPFDAPAGLWLVLARPPSGLSTPDVYRGCTVDSDGCSAAPLIAALQRGDAAAAACHLQNGLQPAAECLSADVLRLKDEFSRLPVLGHQLTGSGSAWFGICRNRRHALRCAERLKSRGVAAVWTVATCC